MFVDTSLTTSFSAINYQLCNHKNRDRIRTILTSPTLKKTTAFNFFLNIVFMLSECCFSSVQFSCSVVSDSLSSVQFSRLVVSDSLQPHELKHARPPCPSSSPAACSSSYPLSQWYHPIISSSVIPFSSCLQSFSAPGSLFQWVSSLHQVVKILEFQLQHQSFQWMLRTDFL